MPSLLFIIPNTIFILAAIVLVYRITGAGSKYNWSVGDNELQNKLKFVIIHSILILFVLAFIAALFNILLV